MGCVECKYCKQEEDNNQFEYPNNIKKKKIIIIIALKITVKELITLLTQIKVINFCKNSMKK